MHHTLYARIVLSDPRTLLHVTSAAACSLGVTSQKKILTPFPRTLPPELVRAIFEYTASTSPAPFSLQLVNHTIRAWTHPLLYATLEIFGLQRMINFSQVYFSDLAGCRALLGKSVKDLSLFDDTTGDFVHLATAAAALDNNAFMGRILEMCKGVRRLAVNYIRGIPRVVGATPKELTIRRGLRGINLNHPPFEQVTRIHCRYEQLMPYVLRKLALDRLTHVCFTHHLDFPDETCLDVVSSLLEQPQMLSVIVEVTYQRWHRFVDPGVRRMMAQRWPAEKRLVVRLSRYETVSPYDEERVFRDGLPDVWDVKDDQTWRDKEWDPELIMGVCRVG